MIPKFDYSDMHGPFATVRNVRRILVGDSHPWTRSYNLNSFGVFRDHMLSLVFVPTQTKIIGNLLFELLLNKFCVSNDGIAFKAQISMILLCMYSFLFILIKHF